MDVLTICPADVDVLKNVPYSNQRRRLIYLLYYNVGRKSAQRSEIGLHRGLCEMQGVDVGLKFGFQERTEYVAVSGGDPCGVFHYG